MAEPSIQKLSRQSGADPDMPLSRLAGSGPDAGVGAPRLALVGFVLAIAVACLLVPFHVKVVRDRPIRRKALPAATGFCMNSMT